MVLGSKGGSGFLPDDLCQIADREGTPAYVYDLNILNTMVRRVRAAFNYKSFELLFATMANTNETILQSMNRMEVGACVNSMIHVERVLASGFPPERVHFTSSGIPGQEMRVLGSLGITVNLDSPMQVGNWLDFVDGGKVGLRVNAATLGLPPGRSADRMGMSADEVPSVIAFAKERGLVIEGLHVYVGTNFLIASDMLSTLDAFFRLAATIPDLRYVNIGGGLGVDYAREGNDFQLEEFGRAVCDRCAETSAKIGHDVTLIFEPGRGLVASSGQLLTTVTDVKRLGGIRYLTVDASVSLFPRPLVHPGSFHKVRCLSNNSAFETTPCTIVGRTTFSRDILGEALLSEAVQPGDILVFEDAGAYSESMISRFLGQREPKSIVMDSNKCAR